MEMSIYADFCQVSGETFEDIEVLEKNPKMSCFHYRNSHLKFSF